MRRILACSIAGALAALAISVPLARPAGAAGAFDTVRWGSIKADAKGAITASGGEGVDMVVIVEDDHGRVTWGQHPVNGPAPKMNNLSVADRASLSESLDKYMKAHANADPLWKQLYHDVTPTMLPPPEPAHSVFKTIRLGSIGIEASGGTGVDMVITIRADEKGELSYAEHPVMGPAPAKFQPLTPQDKQALAEAIEAFLKKNPGADQLWKRLLGDAEKK
jgi:hypothetical protein